MKNLLLLLLFFYSASGFGFKPGDLNVTGGFGVHGNRGLLGFSADKFLSQNHALSFAVGIDFVGATSSAGYKYFTDKIAKSNSIWDKCFFIFECDSFFYIGPSVQYAGGSRLKVTEGSDEREYNIDPKWLGLIGVGVRSVFKNNFTLDAEISYRSIFAGGDATQTSGLMADDTEAIESGFRAAGINVGIGYVF